MHDQILLVLLKDLVKHYKERTVHYVGTFSIGIVQVHKGLHQPLSYEVLNHPAIVHHDQLSPELYEVQGHDLIMS